MSPPTEPRGREDESALDAQLALASVDGRPEDWREKVAIAKEAREIGARTHSEVAPPSTLYGFFSTL